MMRLGPTARDAAPVSTEATAAIPVESKGDQRLALLLAMAMFVLVVDTSLMNVSISAVVRDLDPVHQRPSAARTRVRLSAGHRAFVS